MALIFTAGLTAAGAVDMEPFDIEDLFPLHEGNFWHYIGTVGTDLEDDFRWDREVALKEVGPGVFAVGLKTTTDEGDDSREDDVDYWQLDENGVMWFWGFHNGVADGDGAFPSQDVILDAPVKLGERNMTVGSTFTTTGSGSAMANVPIFGSVPVSVSLTMTVTYAECLPIFHTGLGALTNVIRVEVAISGTASEPVSQLSIPIEVFEGEFFLKEGIGMVAQAQKPDSNDAQRQVVNLAHVNGTDVMAPALTDFTVQIDTMQAGVTGSSAMGTADIVIDTSANTLTYDIMFSGLNSDETAAHIHGFTVPGMNAGVAHPIGVGNPIMGTWNYDESDEARILAGLTYINIHTMGNPGGEIRGQIRMSEVTTTTAGMGPPALTMVSQGQQDGYAHLTWTNSNEMPVQFLGFAFDLYSGDFVDHGDNDSIWYSFANTMTMGDMELVNSGGYWVWIANQYSDGSLFINENPMPLVLANGPPPAPLDVTATASSGGGGDDDDDAGGDDDDDTGDDDDDDAGGDDDDDNIIGDDDDVVGDDDDDMVGDDDDDSVPYSVLAPLDVNLQWKPDIFGTWLYWIIAYNVDTGQYVATEGPQGNSMWHYVLWGSADFTSGSTLLTVPQAGNYFIFIAGFGWDATTFSEFGNAYVFVAP